MKSYRFLSFPENIDKDIGENLRGKNNKKLLDSSKKSRFDVLKIIQI